MKTINVASACVGGSLFLMCNISTADSPINMDTHTVVHKAATAKIPFIKNLGQINANKVDYYAKLFSGTLFVTDDGTLVYSLAVNNKHGKPVGWAFRESFLGSRTSHPKGAIPSDIQVSLFKGDRPDAWQRHLPAYDSMSLGEVYPGIRVTLNASGNNVEKVFHVTPGAAVSDIKIAVDGARAVTVDAKGRLILKTGTGDMAFTAPLAYQDIDGKRRAVDASYALKGTTYGFRLGNHDPAYDVVIDPLLASTYVGGRDYNPAWTGNYDQDIAYSVLSTGDSIYIGGVTQSTNFPVKLGYDEIPDAYGRPDGFIARFSNDLTTLYSATYFGTDSFDSVHAITRGSDGTIVAVGQGGYGFPVTSGAYNYQGSEPVGGGFVSKFSPDLSTLVASSVVTPSDYPSKVAVGNGGIYFGGTTNNPDFPITPGAYLTTCCPAGGFGIREYDGFAGKLSSDLSTLQAMTYLGGDNVTAIAVSADSSVYISDGFDSGVTGSLGRFDAALTTRFASVSYYPGTTSGSSRHYFHDVVVGDNYVIAVGQTYLNDLPVTPGAFDTTCGSDGDCDNISSTLYIPKPDGFIARYSPDLQSVQAMTYFGGNDADSIRSVGLDSAGNVYVTGDTISTDMPTTDNAHDRTCGTDGSCNSSVGLSPQPKTDVFVAKLSGDLAHLLYGSYLGGSNDDSAYGLAVAASDSVYVAGQTASADFPTTAGAFDRTYAGGSSGTYDSDAFISQFDTSGSGGGSNIDPVADAGTDQTVGPRQRVLLDGRGSSDSDGQVVQYHWKQVSGKAITLNNADSAVANFISPWVRRGQARNLVFELTVNDNQGAAASDQLTVTVTR